MPFIQGCPDIKWALQGLRLLVVYERKQMLNTIEGG